MMVYILVFIIDCRSFLSTAITSKPTYRAITSCISNVGPVLGEIGPTISGYSYFSKIVLSFIMLAGRLEILSMLILFLPHTWKKLLKRKVYYEQILSRLNRYYFARRFGCLYFVP